MATGVDRVGEKIKDHMRSINPLLLDGNVRFVPVFVVITAGSTQSKHYLKGLIQLSNISKLWMISEHSKPSCHTN